MYELMTTRVLNLKEIIGKNLTMFNAIVSKEILQRALERGWIDEKKHSLLARCMFNCPSEKTPEPSYSRLGLAISL